MSSTRPTPPAVRRTRSALRAVLVVCAVAVIGIVGYQSLGTSSFSAASPIEALLGDRGGGLGEAGGELPDGVTVFDDEYAGVAHLDPELLDAVRSAARDAGADGIELFVNSGWRSAEYQEQLLQDAVAEYGSEEEAARWVSTPETSAHVSGDAIDIGGADAQTWLADHGSTYGLCRIYDNEPWHFELRPAAVAFGCPPTYADPTQDPRMR